MTKNQDCMRIYFQRTFLFLILRRQSISELGLMLMLILISGLIFARFKNKTFITTPPRLSFPSLCYFIEQEDESSNFTSIPTGIYWVRGAVKRSFVRPDPCSCLTEPLKKWNKISKSFFLAIIAVKPFFTTYRYFVNDVGGDHNDYCWLRRYLPRDPPGQGEVEKLNLMEWRDYHFPRDSQKNEKM